MVLILASGVYPFLKSVKTTNLFTAEISGWGNEHQKGIFTRHLKNNFYHSSQNYGTSWRAIDSDGCFEDAGGWGVNRAKHEALERKVLHAELERLKRLTGLGFQLDLCWCPDEISNRHGEVKGNHIFLYDTNEDDALQNLRHEFLDYCISQAIEPYRMVTNKLIKLINKDAYKRKERIVEALKRLLIEREVRD